MERFHDILVYAGTQPATTASRLEIGASSDFLRSLLSSLKDCDGCSEPTVLIFPGEDINTVRAAFDSLSHYKSGLSIIKSKYSKEISYYHL